MNNLIFNALRDESGNNFTNFKRYLFIKKPKSEKKKSMPNKNREKTAKLQTGAILAFLKLVGLIFY